MALVLTYLHTTKGEGYKLQALDCCFQSDNKSIGAFLHESIDHIYEVLICINMRGLTPKNSSKQFEYEKYMNDIMVYLAMFSTIIDQIVCF